MSHQTPLTGTPDDRGDLARKIAQLIRLKRRPDGEEYTQAEIAEGVSVLYRDDQIQDEVSSLRAIGAEQSQIDAAVDAIMTSSPLINRTYVGKLLNGTRDNPSLVVLRYLARWFGVPAAYFFPDDESSAVEREVTLLTALQDVCDSGQLDTLSAVLRSTGELSPSARQTVLQLMILAAEAARENRT